MRNLIAVPILVMALSSCQANSAPVPAGDQNYGLTSGARPITAHSAFSPPSFGTDCYPITLTFRNKGGKVDFPELTGDGDNFYGRVHYGSFNANSSDTELIACPGSDNSFNVPIPSGYTPDWFGNYSFMAHPLTFQSTGLLGVIYSATWIPKTVYFLYAYDDEGNLLEEYQIGPLKAKTSYLKLKSPFQNGFSVPADGYLNLEIVHASS